MDVPMYLEHCAWCGIPFALTVDLRNKLLKCHNTFYCPNGHRQSYVEKSEEEKLREKIKAQEYTIEFFRKLEAERLAKSRARAEKRRKSLKKKS